MAPGYDPYFALDAVRQAPTTAEAFTAAGFGGAGAAPGQQRPQVPASSAGAARFLSLSPEAQAAEVERMALALARAEAELAALRKGGK